MTWVRYVRRIAVYIGVGGLILAFVAGTLVAPDKRTVLVDHRNIPNTTDMPRAAP